MNDSLKVIVRRVIESIQLGDTMYDVIERTAKAAYNLGLRENTYDNGILETIEELKNEHNYYDSVEVIEGDLLWE